MNDPLQNESHDIARIITISKLLLSETYYSIESSTVQNKTSTKYIVAQNGSHYRTATENSFHIA